MAETRSSLCVGASGLLSLGVAGLLQHVPPHPGTFPFPLRGVLAYGVLANILYTVGPAADISCGVGSVTAPPAWRRRSFAMVSSSLSG